MTTFGWLQIVLYLFILLLLVKPLGSYMARVYTGERTFVGRIVGPVERLIYRILGLRADDEMDWKTYAVALLLFSLVGLLALYGLQRLQSVLPLNPQNLGAVDPDTAFNAAASFTTNTNWQGYSGETTMSYLTQMAGLAWHNFISAAAGIAVAIALARGLTRRGDGKRSGTIGNFWVDMTRVTVYVLVPICFVMTLVFVSQGMIQNLAPYRDITTLEGGK